MGRAGANLIAQADVITAVPLHWTRLFSRRYNQAALLAQAIGRRAAVPVVPDLLVRRRKTPSQGGLGPAQRRRNLQGALAPSRRHASSIDDASSPPRRRGGGRRADSVPGGAGRAITVLPPKADIFQLWR